MIFVDTGAWFASTVPEDVNHAAATTWLAGNTRPLVTTDYIIDEILSLLRARGYSAQAIEIGDAFFRGSLSQIVRIGEADLQTAWSIFRHFRDKEWSFTDCTSKAVIERLRISDAFAFDHHFRQFGSVAVVP